MEAGVPRTTQLQELIRKHIPKPSAYASAEDQAFYGCIQCEGCNDGECATWKAAVAKQGFDAGAMAVDLETYVVGPLKAVQKAFTTIPYLTRLYTLVSPSEMNKDPIFAFNKELPDVDNVHSAKATPICDAGNDKAHSILLEFKSGHELTVATPKDDGRGSMCFGFGFGGGAPIGIGQGSGPVNAAGGQPAWKVEVLDETGLGLEVDPRDADLVDAKLNDAKAGKPSLDADFIATLKGSSWDPTQSTQTPTKAANAGKSSSGCTTGRGHQGGTGALALALMALIAIVARRRLDVAR
jgi:uncharacterized protein (TIGR03382 family)